MIGQLARTYKCAHTFFVDCEWDPRKASRNLEKHEIEFADAAVVLHDESAVTVPDEDADEERFVTVGRDAMGRVLVLVYTWRGERVRILSARRATARERRRYEERP